MKMGRKCEPNHKVLFAMLKRVGFCLLSLVLAEK